MSDVWTPSDEFTANEGDLGDLAFINYEDLIPSLQKDLLLDLSTDAVQHTGNDVPTFQAIPSTWFGSNWMTDSAFPNWWSAQYFVDANGWVNLRGLVKPVASYSYAAATAVVLNIPAELQHPTQYHMFQQIGVDSNGSYFIARVDVAAGNAGASAGQLILVQGVGTNNGAPGSFLNLNGVRWNYKG